MHTHNNGQKQKGLPEGFPAAAWEKLNSIEANTEAMLDIGKEIEGKDSVSVVRQFLIQVMHVPKASNFYIRG